MSLEIQDTISRKYQLYLAETDWNRRQALWQEINDLWRRQKEEKKKVKRIKKAA